MTDHALAPSRGFCTGCGMLHDASGTCAKCGPASLAPKGARKNAVVKYPGPPPMRRFLASGLEFLAVFLLEVVGTVTWILGPFTSFGAFLYWLLRDVNGGGWSFGKRLARLQVVAVASGKPAPGWRCVLRNLPCALGWLISVAPDPVGHIGHAVVLICAVGAVGVGLITPRGRRLGDLLAGTQVIALEE